MKRKSTPQHEARRLVKQAKRAKQTPLVQLAVQLLPVLADEIARLEQRVKEVQP